MNLISVLVRYSPGVVITASFVGLLGGLASAALIGIINLELEGGGLALGQAAIAFVALILVSSGASYGARLLMVNLSQKTIFDLRADLSRQALATPLARLEEIGPHRILAALTQDVEAITGALINLPSLAMNGSMVVGCLIYLGILSWQALLSLAGFIALAYLSYALPDRRAQVHLRRAREGWDQMVNHYRALLGGMKELKQHRPRRESFLAELLDGTAEELRHNYITAGRSYALAYSFSQALYFVFIGLVILVLPQFLEIDRSVLTGYTLVAIFMRGPLGAVLDVIPSFGRAVASRQKIEQLGVRLAPPAVRGELPPAPAAPPSPCLRLELTGVTHRYHREGVDHPFTLGPVDCTLRSGELSFVVGGNGSGKTTLAKMITGLYPPESGELRLDGAVIDEGLREWYRGHFSAVWSDFFLFDQLLGSAATPDLAATVAKYLRLLELDHKVRFEGGRLSTTELSQGQRKRLALLTAYLEDRPIYLFDEWAADQDPAFKETFYLELLPELRARGKMVIVISHDDRYYHLADQIVKLDSGRLVPAEAVASPAPS